MSSKIFVNLPVKDLAKSIEFFTSVGYTFNEQLTDDKAGCLVITQDIFAMLLAEPFYSSFTNKPIADPATSEVIIALSQDSREDVDRLAQAALAAGAQPAKETDDQGFMYTRSFYDLDGHHWEIFHMDPAAVQG